jgi:hypothetical protein
MEAQMGLTDTHIPTMLYLHPRIRSWVETRARFDGDTMSGVIRRIIRDHIQDSDPEGWERIAEALREESKATEDTEQAAGA